MLIKIEDDVTVNEKFGANTRYGKVTDISIATMSGDPAGELGVQIQEYDTELNYNGSIGYVTENGDQHWAYFSQILKDI